MSGKSFKPISLSVEGNIGSGKTTLLQILHEHFSDRVEIMKEPVDKWKDIKGENILEAFYANPERYAYTFQTYAFITRMMQLQQKQTKQIRLLERSPLSDYCFAKNCSEMGLMNEIEWKLYQEWWSHFVSMENHTPSGIIYLRTSPEICLERVNSRKRPEERNMEIQYLNLLHKQHENWFIEQQGSISKDVKVPFIILEGNKEFENCKEAQELMCDKIEKLIKEISQKNE